MRALVLLLVLFDATAWFREGVAKHDAGDYNAAIAAFAKAREEKYANVPQLDYRTARTLARKGDNAGALDALQRAVNNGFGPLETILAENDFLSIRSEARWPEIVAAARKSAHPCASSAESRQFDFWLGEWDVENAQKQKIARSSIQLILDECVIFENFEASGGYSGKSLSAWDAGEHEWEQHYTDTTGASRYWTGALIDGRMVMTTSFARGGAKVTQRMTYSKEGADRVRQFIETSTDDGKTWTPGFDGMYIRRH
ncbi:MAG TPA: hypothetical protein VFN10_13950 [Thermoanaerobaculia bacterium]|nr:hypothetical protein [Thermoanaerobaculia bacterium]